MASKSLRRASKVELACWALTVQILGIGKALDELELGLRGNRRAAVNTSPLLHRRFGSPAHGTSNRSLSGRLLPASVICVATATHESTTLDAKQIRTPARRRSERGTRHKCPDKAGPFPRQPWKAAAFMFVLKPNDPGFTPHLHTVTCKTRAHTTRCVLAPHMIHVIQLGRARLKRSA